MELHFDLSDRGLEEAEVRQQQHKQQQQQQEQQEQRAVVTCRATDARLPSIISSNAD